MITGGLRARLASVDTKQLDAAFVGREFNEALLRALPADVDPCGERGEFHTCVYAGPMFRDALELSAGDVVVRDGFAYADFACAGTLRDQAAAPLHLQLSSQPKCLLRDGHG
jgi:diphthamide synthase (EF-2-diphthine--ammonia ligase)